jgi:hypothetical protein
MPRLTNETYLTRNPTHICQWNCYPPKYSPIRKDFNMRMCAKCYKNADKICKAKII